MKSKNSNRATTGSAFYTERVELDLSADNGAPSLADLGSVDVPSSPPHRITEEYAWKRYLKRTQFLILLVLMATIFVAMGLEIVYRLLFEQQRNFFQDLVSYVMPIFTFLLGMGAQSREKQE